jgi:hypothetical protein
VREIKGVIFVFQGDPLAGTAGVPAYFGRLSCMSGPQKELSVLCPWCDYDISACAPDAVRCPECGGDTGRKARAIAEMRRATRKGWARVLFLASPGIEIFGGAGLFWMGQQLGLGVPTVVLCILGAPVACAFVVLWLAGGSPSRRRPGRAAVLAVPMGLAYILAVMVVAFFGALIAVAVIGK